MVGETLTGATPAPGGSAECTAGRGRRGNQQPWPGPGCPTHSLARGTGALPPARPSAGTWEGGWPRPALGPGFLHEGSCSSPPITKGLITICCQDSHPSKRVGQRHPSVSSDVILHPEATGHRARRHSQRPTHTFSCARSSPPARAWVLGTGRRPWPRGPTPGTEKGPL